MMYVAILMYSFYSYYLLQRSWPYTMHVYKIVAKGHISVMCYMLQGAYTSLTRFYIQIYNNTKDKSGQIIV